MDERERYEKGLTVRRAVLGDAHVDRSFQNRNDFNAESQELITHYAWGEIWTRTGFPCHTRSLLTIAMMVALNRSDEFRLHLRAAFKNGVTREEIKELLLQVAIFSLSACFSKAPYVEPSLNRHLEGLWFAETTG